ncbi:MAG: TlpA family protein disulfide reductase [Gammaproteobacteria bacterium]|nr:MAG: TlpA family protein disulfide reductase [Gammaproteobacteria bacterium]
MSDGRPPHSRAGAGGASFAAAVLIASAAGGFLAYRLAHPTRATLRATSPVPAAPAAAPTGPRAAEATPSAAASAASPAAKIPEVLPDLTLPGLDGTPHRLTDWKGHALLVNFWATWCEPCRREIPLLRSLRRERSADGLEVIGIAIDYSDAAEKYAREARIDYPVLLGEQGGYEAAAAFGMEPVLPFSVFADRTGRVVTLKVGELHPDEAGFILDRIRDVEAGRLSLSAAREQIESGIGRLNVRRAASARDGAH